LAHRSAKPRCRDYAARRSESFATAKAPLTAPTEKERRALPASPLNPVSRLRGETLQKLRYWEIPELALQFFRRH